MRAIIIEDKDCKALLDALKLQSFEMHLSGREMQMLQEAKGLTEEECKWVIKAVHGAFHYRVCTWLQQHGGSPL